MWIYWECNLDNENYIDRCQEVRYENLNAQLQKESISAHLRSYDYAAALEVARQVRSLLSPRAYALLEAAKARLELNWRSIKPDIKAELGLLETSGRNLDRTFLISGHYATVLKKDASRRRGRHRCFSYGRSRSGCGM